MEKSCNLTLFWIPHERDAANRGGSDPSNVVPNAQAAVSWPVCECTDGNRRNEFDTAQDQTQTPLPILRVFVRDSATQDTLTGGSVELRSRDIKRSAQLSTNGIALFTSLPSGAYSISIVRIG